MWVSLKISNSSLNLNYKVGKVNMYANYGLNHGKNVNHGYVDSFRETYESHQDFGFNNLNTSHLLKLGIDYYINDKNTLSFYTNRWLKFLFAFVRLDFAVSITHFFSTYFLSLFIVLVTIGSIFVIGLDKFQNVFILNLVIFSCVMGFAFLNLITKLRYISKKTRVIKQEEEYNINLSEESKSYSKRSRATQEIQTTIKIMILSIVILDSVFLSGLVGLTAGMATLMLLVPPILLGRRLYVT